MTTRPYLTCRQMIDFLMDYLSGELEADTRGEFERHLSVCPPCVDFMDSYRKTVKLARDAGREPPAPAGDGLPDELVQAILKSIDARK